MLNLDDLEPAPPVTLERIVTGYRLPDWLISESTARLGSPSTLDRLGAVGALIRFSHEASNTGRTLENRVVGSESVADRCRKWSQSLSQRLIEQACELATIASIEWKDDAETFVFRTSTVPKPPASDATGAFVNKYIQLPNFGFLATWLRVAVGRDRLESVRRTIRASMHGDRTRDMVFVSQLGEAKSLDDALHELDAVALDAEPPPVLDLRHIEPSRAALELLKAVGNTYPDCWWGLT